MLVLTRYRRSEHALSLPPCREGLHIDTSTVHRAKGREAEFVVVVDLTDGRYGFPSRVEDDPADGPRAATALGRCVPLC